LFIVSFLCFGAVHEIRPQSGGGDLFSADMGEGVIQMRTSALYQIFRNLWCVRTDKEGAPVWTFCGQGAGGQFFAILCGRPLWTAPSCLNLFIILGDRKRRSQQHL